MSCSSSVETSLFLAAEQASSASMTRCQSAWAPRGADAVSFEHVSNRLHMPLSCLARPCRDSTPPAPPAPPVCTLTPPSRLASASPYALQIQASSKTTPSTSAQPLHVPTTSPHLRGNCCRPAACSHVQVPHCSILFPTKLHDSGVPDQTQRRPMHSATSCAERLHVMLHYQSTRVCHSSYLQASLALAWHYHHQPRRQPPPPSPTTVTATAHIHLPMHLPPPKRARRQPAHTRVVQVHEAAAPKAFMAQPRGPRIPPLPRYHTRTHTQA